MNFTVHRRIGKESEELKQEYHCTIQKEIDIQHSFINKYKKYEYIVDIKCLSNQYLKEKSKLEPIKRSILFLVSEHYPFRAPDIFIKHYYPIYQQSLQVIEYLQPCIQNKIKEYLELENPVLYHFSEYMELYMKNDGMEDFCKTWKYQFERKYFSSHYAATIRMKEIYHDLLFFFHVVDKIGFLYPHMNLNTFFLETQV